MVAEQDRAEQEWTDKDHRRPRMTGMTTPAIFNSIAGTGNPPLASGDEILTSLNNDMEQLYQLLVKQ